MDEVSNWLLEDETPEIKYRTMTELLGMSKNEPEVKKAYDNLVNSKIVGMLMDKFKLDEKWEDFNAFCAIAEFGLTRADVPIDNYVERIIANTNFDMMCGKVLLLRNLVALGYYEHNRVQDEIPKAFSIIREDGSFRCLSKKKKSNDSNLPDMGCYRQTTTYLLLAAELKKRGIILPQFESLVNFYLNYNVIFRSDKIEDYIIQEMAGTFYPFDPVKIGLQMIMYGLSVLGAANHPNCKNAWELLESKKDGEGRYALDKSLSKPYFKVGKVGKPNKWVTLYILLANKYCTDRAEFHQLR